MTAIEALDKATMYSRQKVYLGVSCRTAPEGDVEWLKQAKIGDTVFLGKHSFKVGIIETVAFSEDLKTKGGKLLAAKGDTQCVLAANEQSLPYDQKRCDGLWVFNSQVPCNRSDSAPRQIVAIGSNPVGVSDTVARG